MVVRVAGLAYQKGFGGHFHNDNAVGVLRDIPGLVVACPARADDAAAMLRTCVAAAIADATVSVFLEPIALYHRRDLYDDGRRAAGSLLIMVRTSPIGPPAVPTGPRQLRARSGARSDHDHVRQRGADVPAGGAPAGAAGHPGRGDSIFAGWPRCRSRTCCTAGRRTGRVLVVDETRHSGGVGEGVITALVEGGFGGPHRPGFQPGQLRALGRRRAARAAGRG